MTKFIMGIGFIVIVVLCIIIHNQLLLINKQNDVVAMQHSVITDMHELLEKTFNDPLRIRK